MDPRLVKLPFGTVVFREEEEEEANLFCSSRSSSLISCIEELADEPRSIFLELLSFFSSKIWSNLLRAPAEGEGLHLHDLQMGLRLLLT